MKIKDLCAKNSTPDTPSDLVKAYIACEEGLGTLQDFLLQFEYDSRDDVERGVRTLCNAIVADRYLGNKMTQQAMPNLKLIYKRYTDILSRASSCDKFPMLRAAELWHGVYGRRRLDDRVRMLLDGERDASLFGQASAEIQRVYHLTDIDMHKITYFVQQVRAGEDFPPSLRRMLYLWGERKKTGKTTVAGMLTTILNGDVFGNLSFYSTTLTNEMQIRSFTVPIISTCNVALMDECFYADMGKTYSDFKRFITSNNGRARLPYGQEFEWQGYPNYIATSNDPLRVFIKDWNDRRYLSVQFTDNPAAMDFEDIYAIWLQFVRNIPTVSDWKEETQRIESISEEVGERMERTEELVIELQQPVFIDDILSKTADVKTFSPKNKLTLKYFVDYFARTIGTAEAAKRRGEIEKAVEEVYGKRYSTTNYWLLPELQKKATAIRYDQVDMAESSDADKIDDDGLLF